jgi:hypothetical protein
MARSAAFAYPRCGGDLEGAGAVELLLGWVVAVHDKRWRIVSHVAKMHAVCAHLWQIKRAADSGG